MSMQKKNKPASKALLALTGSALSLPGISGKAAAADPVTETSIDYQYSNYREEDLPSSKHAGGDVERYEIDTHQLRVVRPWGDSYDVTVDLMYETMSGASPWFIMPGANGEPLQVMSGATIEDDRSDILAKVRKLYDNSAASLSLGYSDEDDYRAINVGIEGEWDLGSKQRTFTVGLGYSDDELEPTDGGTTLYPNRVTSAEKDSLSVYAGFTQVLNARTTVQSTLSFTRHDGFLSDPYKEAFVAGNRVQDNRPDGRDAIAWLTRLRHFVPSARGALHVDYRYFDDDWEIESHTLELGWHQNLPADWQLSPSVRYYSQSQAFFYAPYYNSARSDGFASSDYRLSPYGALSYRLRATKKIGTWAFHLGWERYTSEADLAIKSVRVENPGLVEFNAITFGISRHF